MPELPAEALRCLTQTHAEGCRTLQQAGYTPESVEIAIEVERHRWFWRPKQPELILLAESHVLTTDRDTDFRTDETTISSFRRRNAKLPPDCFVRLVYCLAYGESELLSQQPAHISNPGTPSYWDIFGRVAFRCPQPRREDGAGFNDRMRWKVDTLRELYKMGIWLLDASVHAIYLRNQVRLPLAIQQRLHKQWWEGYGRFLMGNCEFPKVWVIGKTVHNCITTAQFADWTCEGWVYQPNAPVNNPNRNWPKLLKDCWALRRVAKT
jgi:hypothetical protein